jgi:hypothetical protein
VSWLPDYRHWAARRTYLSEYLPLLFGSVARYREPVVVEIGTYRGESTVSLLAGAELAGGHVWSIDIDPHVPFLKVLDAHDEADRKMWTFVNGDSTALTSARQVPGRIDVLFIDGDHRYDQVVAELKLYLPRMRGGGVALLHDVHPSAFGDPELCRVGEALDDTLPGMGLRWQDLPGVVGLGVIRMPVTEPCFFCHAQATGRWTAETEKQQAFAGASPVDVCDGCRVTASQPD